MSLRNKTVVITGAAKGIGAACVKSFIDEGASVALLDIAFPDSAGDEDNKMLIHGDASSGKEVESAMQKAYDRYGSIDVLVNNVGIQRYGTVTETTAAEWDEVMNVNLKSYFLGAKYALPYMQKKGTGVIVNVASVQAFLSQEKVAAYTTAKSAILGLTRSIAVDYAPGIRCIAVCPGTIDTPMLRDAIALSPDPGEVMRECVDMHLLKRIGKAEEVAALIAFLCDDKASFITGQAIRIDGGLGVTIPGSKKEE